MSDDFDDVRPGYDDPTIGTSGYDYSGDDDQGPNRWTCLVVILSTIVVVGLFMWALS